MRTYAQIDEMGICFAITRTSGVIDSPRVILLDDPDADVMGKRWNGTAFVPV